MCLANFEVGASGEFLNDETFDSEESKKKCYGEMFRVVRGKWNRSGWYQMLHGIFYFILYFFCLFLTSVFVSPSGLFATLLFTLFWLVG